MTSLLQIRGLQVIRGGQPLLQPLDLDLGAGTRLAILGANGAGKSTLLRCLAGDIHDWQGELRFDQQPLSVLAPAQRARRIAVMPQHTELAFPFTAAEVVALGRTPFADERQTRHWQQQAMALTECWHLRQRRYPGLSGGEQQRVQLARVLVQIWQALRQEGPPCLLLLDECTSALDPAHQHHIMAAVSHFADAGVGVIAVMHDLALAASWADRILLLKQGHALYEGAVSGLTSADLLASCYDLAPDLARRYAHSNHLWQPR